MSTPILQIQVQRAPGDCGVCALSMYLGTSYEDTLAAAVHTTKLPRLHHRGMHAKDMRATAKRLGVTLTLKRGFDVEQDEGVLAVRDDAKDEEHYVLLKAGLIFEGDGTVWHPDVWAKHYKYRPLSLLVKQDD